MDGVGDGQYGWRLSDNIDWGIWIGSCEFGWSYGYIRMGAWVGICHIFLKWGDMLEMGRGALLYPLATMI